MLKVLMSRRWLTAIAVAAAFAVACVLLGRWQWHRHEERTARADRISSHYRSTPTDLGSVIPEQNQPLAPAKEWTPVTVTGQYSADSQLLVRNRPNEGVYGYEVVVPLQLGDGSSLLVDRGWIPNGRNAAEPSTAPGTPFGDVTVTGWLRVGEPSLGGQPARAGQLRSINVAEARQRTGADLYDAYLALKDEKPALRQSVVRPKPLETPDTDLGSHLGYTFQWWLGAPLGFVLVFVYARREHLDALAGHGQSPATVPRKPAPTPERPRRTRIWDEEDA